MYFVNISTIYYEKGLAFVSNKIIMFVARVIKNSNPYSSTIGFPSSSMNPLLCRSFRILASPS